LSFVESIHPGISGGIILKSFKLHKLFLLFIAIFLSAGSKAQQNNPAKKNKKGGLDVIFTRVEQDAAFPGGTSAWQQFIEQKLRTDSLLHIIAANPGISDTGKAFSTTADVQFIINKDGSISNIKVLNTVHPAFKAEAERVIGLSPKWKPANQCGNIVKAYRRQSISIQQAKE
jgi:periplasmic protein TonB